MRPLYRPPAADATKPAGQGAEVPSPVQGQLRSLVDQFGESDVSKLTAAVAIGTATTKIAHGLGSVPMGWTVVSPNALATVCETQAPDSQFLYLKASAAVTAKLRVF